MFTSPDPAPDTGRSQENPASSSVSNPMIRYTAGYEDVREELAQGETRSEFQVSLDEELAVKPATVTEAPALGQESQDARDAMPAEELQARNGSETGETMLDLNEDLEDAPAETEAKTAIEEEKVVINYRDISVKEAVDALNISPDSPMSGVDAKEFIFAAVKDKDNQGAGVELDDIMKFREVNDSSLSLEAKEIIDLYIQQGLISARQGFTAMFADQLELIDKQADLVNERGASVAASESVQAESEITYDPSPVADSIFAYLEAGNEQQLEKTLRVLGPQQLAQVEEVFQQRFNMELWDRVSQSMDASYSELMRTRIEANKTAMNPELEKIADKIFAAVTGEETNRELLEFTMKDMDKETLAELAENYERKYDSGMMKDIRESISPEEFPILLASISGMDPNMIQKAQELEKRVGVSTIGGEATDRGIFNEEVLEMSELLYGDKVKKDFSQAA